VLGAVFLGWLTDHRLLHQCAPDDCGGGRRSTLGRRRRAPTAQGGSSALVVYRIM